MHRNASNRARAFARNEKPSVVKIVTNNKHLFLKIKENDAI